ncbi:hypothetical protein RUM44_010502 [Polyplax serrata]|uniref:Autophagy-related protein 16 domain-containing protein n=1 Tax=Polyplax serrata TaxID=468196 RepID=A0ABR1AVP4_POLSC
MSVKLDNKLIEDSTSLRDENLQLTIENDKLRKECREGRGGGISSGADQEKIQSLEQKILHQQEELTSLHKRRGEYAQQIVDLNAELQDRNKTIVEKDAKITRQIETINSLKAEISLYVTHVNELDTLNQTIRDEHTALQLAFSSLEEKLRKVQTENHRLVDKLMKYKSKDADKLNEENENFMKKKQATMLKELEEAVKDSSRGVSPEVGMVMIDVKAAVPTSPHVHVDVHDGEVNAVRWSPVDHLVATGGADRKVKLWDVSKVAMCENKGVLIGSNAGVMSVDFDSTGTLILAASNDFASRVWTVADQRLRRIK